MAPCVPEEVTYKDKTNLGTRTYKVLKRRVWTHVVNDHFWEATKLPCAIKYYGGRVCETFGSQKYISVRGTCTYCYASFEAVIPNSPHPEQPAAMQCTYKGRFKQTHPKRPNLKRNLSGAARDLCVERQVKQCMTASTIQRLDADRLMQFGDHIPAHLPSTNVMRVAKSQELQKGRLHKDPIVATAMAMHLVPYQGVIRSVHYDPLSVAYYSEAQLHVYKHFCKQTGVPSLKIDASGNVVSSVSRASRGKSGVIFVYNAVVRDATVQKTFSVSL